MILNASIYIVFALLLIDCALLLLVVMMQRPKQEGLGAAFGAQMTDQAFGAQTTDVLKKGTVLFGTLFMVLSFVLAVLMNAQFRMKKSTLGTDAPVAAKVETPAPAATLPAAPVENLEILEATTPGAPVAPAPAAETPAPTLPEAPAAPTLPEAPTAPAEPSPAVETAPVTPAEAPAA